MHLKPGHYLSTVLHHYFFSYLYAKFYFFFSADKDKHHVRPGAPSEPNEYNFNYRRRGVFLIFNNKHFLESTGQLEREGTDADAERLEERFQDTGFEVRRYDDVTYARMTKLMEDSKYQKCSETTKQNNEVHLYQTKENF